MRVLQMLLLAALVIVLSVIAIDLHRLVGTLQPDGATMTAIFGSPSAREETQAEYNARMQRSVDRIVNSWSAAAAAMPSTVKRTTKNAPESSR